MGLPLINKRFGKLSILFLERSVVVGDLMSSQIPLIFYSLVTQSTCDGASRRMHVQHVLKNKEGINLGINLGEIGLNEEKRFDFL